MNNILVLILCVIFFILTMFNQFLIRENFSNYLFSTKKKLTDDCKKEGLKPAYMPTSCIIDDKLKAFSNCKCIDKNGICKICYPEIKKKEGRSINYNPDEFNKNKQEINKRMNDYLKK